MASKKKTYKQLERELMELQAQLVHNYHFADAGLSKAGQDRMAASAVVIRLTALGGNELIPPVAIRGGLSAETIAAIRSDLVRSYADAVVFKPKGA
jgi:hypothetical protein